MMSKTAHMALLLAICTLSAATAHAVALQTSAKIDVIGLDGKKASVSLRDLPRKTLNTADAAGIKTTHEGSSK